jgi:hypothetical protein
MTDSEHQEDYKDLLKTSIFREESFLRLTLSGKIRGKDAPWIKAVVRPIELRGKLKYQITYYDQKRGVTQNYDDKDFLEKLDELLTTPFNQIHLQASTGDLHIRITKKGKTLLKKAKPSRPEPRPELSHNRQKRYPLSSSAPDEFLHEIGIMDQSGSVKPSMQDKFRQINEFLRLMDQVVTSQGLLGDMISIVDCGCGNAYLTFSGYHYLNHIQGRDAQVVGIDSRPEAIEKCIRLRDSLGWSGLEFSVSRIEEFTPSTSPDMVLSLHACNTATDEAIARGVIWQSQIILAAPCCQHELRPQIEATLFDPVLRHGVLKQRTAEILTDACRAEILHIMGYRTDVVQFIDSKHTPKNLMIRARKGLKPGNRQAVDRYMALRDFWRIKPSIERLLNHELRPYFNPKGK